MDIINSLKEHGIVSNISALESLLIPLTSRESTSSDFLDSQTVYFYSKDARTIREYNFIESSSMDIKIVKYLSTRNFFSDPWCFGFVKEVEADGTEYWSGVYAGKHGELFNKLKKICRDTRNSRRRLLSRVEFPRPITKSDIFKKANLDEISQQVYLRLKDTEEWDNLGGISYLRSHLENLSYVVRDRVLFNKEPLKYVKVTDRGKFIDYTFNTGLFDKYLNFIFIKMTLMEKSFALLNEPYYLVDKFALVIPTTKVNETTEMPPVSICGREDLLFPQDKIDLGGYENVMHIFDERLDRLPGFVEGMNKELLYYSLRDSIAHTNNQLKVSPNYVVPFFNIKWGVVSFLVPLYIRHLNADSPVCAVVLGHTEEQSWSPVTILSLDTARSNARLLGKVTAEWLVERRSKSSENSLCK